MIKNLKREKLPISFFSSKPLILSQITSANSFDKQGHLWNKLVLKKNSWKKASDNNQSEISEKKYNFYIFYNTIEFKQR